MLFKKFSIVGNKPNPEKWMQLVIIVHVILPFTLKL